MAITREEVLHVARLARLPPSDVQAGPPPRAPRHPSDVGAARPREQLGNLLDYIRQLDTLDTRDVVPTSHAVEMGTTFRDDSVRPFGDKEAILANAPDRVDDFFRVPRIIED